MISDYWLWSAFCNSSDTCRSRSVTSASSSRAGISANCSEKTVTTISIFRDWVCWRTSSYKRRLIRFRTTADLLTFLLTTTATRNGLPGLLAMVFIASCWLRTVLPRLYTTLRLLCPWKRCSRPSICAQLYYAARRARPLVRRRCKTARPALVAILFIKPCSRARWRFFGW
jgi:hypothetical protein